MTGFIINMRRSTLVLIQCAYAASSPQISQKNWAGFLNLRMSRRWRIGYWLSESSIQWEYRCCRGMKAEELDNLIADKKRSVSSLVRFMNTRAENQSNYAFLWGAGASVSSGVRAASSLVSEWKKELTEEWNIDEEQLEAKLLIMQILWNRNTALTLIEIWNYRNVWLYKVCKLGMLINVIYYII